MAAYDIFISFKNLDADGKPTRDSVLAGELYEFFTNHGLKVFLSSKSLEQLGTANYKRAIDSALEATQILVAIGTSKENLESKWVEYEWDSFLNEIKSGRKPKGQVFVYTEELGVAELPYALRQNQTFRHGPESLQTLLNFISNALELSPAPSKDSVPQPPKDGTRHPPVSSTDSEKKRYGPSVSIKRSLKCH